MELTMLFIIWFVILIVINDYIKWNIKYINFKKYRDNVLCNYLKSNILFFDNNIIFIQKREELKDFLINQYYENAIFYGIKVIKEKEINDIYNNITLNSLNIIELYNESCQ